MRNRVRMRRIPVVFFFLFPLAMTCASGYGQGKVKITGTYTSMEYIPEAGDVVGEELRIVGISPAYQGAFQDAEGVPGPLIIVNIKIAGSKISFDLPPGAGWLPPGRFEGTIQDGVIRGHHFSNGKIVGDEVVMRRGKSYWD